MLDELADVLCRSKFEAMLASRRVTPGYLMQRYGMLTTLVTPLAIERTARDIDDDAVIATALAAHADLIVTGDRDLLALRSHRQIEILSPADAAQQVTGKTAQ